MTEEILDLVDDNDHVIGQLSRDEIYKRNLSNYRVVHGLLINKEGKLWIPRRTATKKIHPNALDFSSAGHVESGETYEASFRRETREELNLDLETVPWRELGKLTPTDGAHCFQMVYEIQSDVAPRFNTADFSEAKWLFPKEVVEMIEAGTLAKSDLAFTIRRFYLERVVRIRRPFNHLLKRPRQP
jgi:isopentenyldiphosphate isomerase